MKHTPLALLLTGSLVSASCDGSSADHGQAHRDRMNDATPDGRELPDESLVPQCPMDPDCFAYDACNVECPDYWVCDTHPSGDGKRCTNPGPDLPDSGQDWDCEDIDGRTVCRGADYPDGGGDGSWNCEQQAEFVVCTNDDPSYPSGEGDGPWNCYFSDEFRICESTPGDGGGWMCYTGPNGRECRENDTSFPDDRQWDCVERNGEALCTGRGDVPDGGGGSGWDCRSRSEFVICENDDLDYPDGGNEGEWNCEYSDEFRICREDPEDYPGGGDDRCEPGVQRWCDDATYCSWGKQTCLPDGRWGPCVEPTVGPSGLTDRPATECGCRYFYFNYDCCEDQQDRDGDGNPDCIIPGSHTPPACERDGSLCASCDVNSQCADGLCLFASDGATFCGSSCSASGSCPDGYRCETIRTRSGSVDQCVPTGGCL
jgi:hypothetical protein